MHSAWRKKHGQNVTLYLSVYTILANKVEINCNDSKHDPTPAEKAL